LGAAFAVLRHVSAQGEGSVKEGRFRPDVAWILEGGGQQMSTDQDQVARLIKGLKEQRGMARKDSAKALAQIGPDAKDAVPALVEALKDPDDTVGRYWAAQALRNIGLAAVPTLTQALKDPDDTVGRYWVAQV
jgi:HEAT repeat protein